jgi:hypothetical protein
MTIDFTKGASGLVGLVIVAIIIVVGIMGFLMLATEFGLHFNQAKADPINSTGVLVHGELAGNLTNETATMASEVLPNFVYLIAAGIVIAILFIVGMLTKIR